MSKDVERAPDVTNLVRKMNGQFQKGEGGRPKGSKNKLTLLRQTLEIQLRELSNPKIPAVLEKAVEMALEGDRTMIKLLLELHMTKGVPDEKEAKESVSINILSQKPTERVVNTIEVIEDEEQAGSSTVRPGHQVHSAKREPEQERDSDSVKDGRD